MAHQSAPLLLAEPPYSSCHLSQALHHHYTLSSGAISFAELDASVQGWINHVRYADTWGLRRHLFERHPFTLRPEPSPEAPPRRIYRRRKHRR